jgi:hypothetical protein
MATIDDNNPVRPKNVAKEGGGTSRATATATMAMAMAMAKMATSWIGLASSTATPGIPIARGGMRGHRQRSVGPTPTTIKTKRQQWRQQLGDSGGGSAAVAAAATTAANKGDGGGSGSLEAAKAEAWR